MPEFSILQIVSLRSDVRFARQRLCRLLLSYQTCHVEIQNLSVCCTNHANCCGGVSKSKSQQRLGGLPCHSLAVCGRRWPHGRKGEARNTRLKCSWPWMVFKTVSVAARAHQVSNSTQIVSHETLSDCVNHITKDFACVKEFMASERGSRECC